MGNLPSNSAAALPRDQVRRSATKAVTYRVGASTLDIVAVYVLTHRIGTAIGVTLLLNACAVIGYYLHERIWAHVHWGTPRADQAPIARVVESINSYRPSRLRAATARPSCSSQQLRSHDDLV